MKKILTIAALALAVVLPAQAADHLDSPSVAANGALDITDLYAFQSPQNSDNAVIVVGVNPLAGVLSAESFDSRGLYTVNIDNDGDARADISYILRFYRERRGTQYYIAYRLSTAPNGRSNRRNSSSRSRSRISYLGFGTVGENTTNLRGGGMLQANVYEDPFFFDLDGFNDGFNFTGTDFFAGANISGIVLEVPSSDLAGPNVAVWATTLDNSGQFDRMGRPAISTALIASARKDAFNQGSPETDFAEFGDEMAATITSLNGGDSATAEAITSILLPDVLTVDVSNSAGFLNGRQLADDVIDAELGLLTNGALTGDGVNSNDAVFGDSFPYLAPAN